MNVRGKVVSVKNALFINPFLPLLLLLLIPLLLLLGKKVLGLPHPCIIVRGTIECMQYRHQNS